MWWVEDEGEAWALCLITSVGTRIRHATYRMDRVRVKQTSTYVWSQSTVVSILRVLNTVDILHLTALTRGPLTALHTTALGALLLYDSVFALWQVAMTTRVLDNVQLSQLTKWVRRKQVANMKTETIYQADCVPTTSIKLIDPHSPPQVTTHPPYVNKNMDCQQLVKTDMNIYAS